MVFQGQQKGRHRNKAFKQRIFIYTGIFIFSIVLSFSYLWAVKWGIGSSAALPCEHSYVENNVSVTLRSPLSKSSPDSQIAVNAEVANNNDYPLRDGVLYIETIQDATSTMPAQFVSSVEVARNIDVSAHALVAITKSWRVPVDAISGIYRLRGVLAFPARPYIEPLVPSVAQARRGDLVMNIISPARGAVFIDPDDITVNGIARPEDTSLSEFEPDQDIAAVLQVTNATPVPYEGTAHWLLYKNGYAPLAEPVASGDIDAKVFAHSTSAISIRIPAQASGMYYVEVVLSSHNYVQSLAGIPIAAKGVCTTK